MSVPLTPCLFYSLNKHRPGPKSKVLNITIGDVTERVKGQDLDCHGNDNFFSFSISMCRLLVNRSSVEEVLLLL